MTKQINNDNKLFSNKAKIMGLRFGHLVVIGENGITKDGVVNWVCRCDCGKIINTAKTKGLRKGITKSCGCTYPRSLKGKYHNSWRGYEDLSSEYYEDIKGRAIVRGLAFEVSMAYLWNLYIEQNKICALTGMPITIYQSCLSRKDCAASVDRIDSTKGYIEGNVQWIHKDVNKMKLDYKEDYFIQICCWVADYYRSQDETSS